MFPNAGRLRLETISLNSLPFLSFCRFTRSPVSLDTLSPSPMTVGATPLSAAVRAAMRTLDRLLPHLRRPHSTTPTSPTPLTLHDYNRLLAAFARDADADAALRVLRRMRHNSCAPTAASYTSAMSALAAAGRPADAAALFDDMLASGVAPDRASFSLLLHLYSSHLHLPFAARSVLLWMSRLGFRPNSFDYSDLVSSLCRAGRLPDALDLLDEMLRRNCPPTPHTYAPILQVYCNNDSIKEADKLIESMRRSGCRPDVVIYNIHVQGLCRIGDFDAVERVIGESGSNGWVPDAVTYSTYIAGLCRFGNVEEAFRQLDVMVAKGLRPTTVGLNILLDCVGQELDAWTSKEVLERCQELGFEVDVVTYNTLMNQFCKKRRWLRVLKLFTDLLKKPITPDVRTFNILISSLCRAGNFQFVKFVFSSRGFVADTVTCNILIHEFYEAGMADELGFLFSDMCVGKITPNMITYNTLVDCLFRTGKVFEATSLVRHIDDGYPAEPVAHLMYWLVRSGNFGETLRLLEEILVKGLVLDGRIFYYVIKAFCRKGPRDCTEMSKLCFVLDKMLGIG